MKKNKAGNDKRESDEETANAESTHKKWKQAWKQTTIANKSMVIASVLIAVSTAIYAGVASYQLAALRESNATNREALVSVQRAFLSFSGIDTGVRMLDPITNMITNQQFHLNITNSGTTPALDGVIRASGRSQKDELPKGFDFVDQTLNIQFIVGPKATDGARVTVPIRNLREQREGKVHFFFWGSVVYRDIFHGTPDRLTEFCVEMSQIAVSDGKKDIADPSNPIGSFTLSPCREHNCYDEKCEDYTARVKLARGK